MGLFAVQMMMRARAQPRTKTTPHVTSFLTIDNSLLPQLCLCRDTGNFRATGDEQCCRLDMKVMFACKLKYVTSMQRGENKKIDQKKNNGG